jgi:signal transduction histidine kinase
MFLVLSLATAWIFIQRERFRYQHSVRREEFEFQMRLKELEVREEFRLSDRNSSFIPKLVEDLPGRIEERVSNQLRTMSRQISKQLEVRQLESGRPHDDPSNDQHNDAQIVREITHALNTPLAEIESSILVLREKLGHAGDMPPELAYIDDATALCKSFLVAFRGLTTVSDVSSAWQPRSMRLSLIAAAELYQRNQRKRIRMEIVVPDSVPGYSNAYLLAITLPLLQNAIESAEIDDVVRVGYSSKGSLNKISVVSRRPRNKLPDDIYSPGVTTKDGHDGLGLATVQRLAASNRGGKISHRMTVENIYFELTLPARKA